MTNERLEFLRLLYQDLTTREHRLVSIKDGEPVDCAGIPYTADEIDKMLYGIHQTRRDITREIQASKENLS